MRALSKVALLRPPTSDEQLAELNAHVRANAGDRPGVYRMIASDGEIVYVGKSKRVRSLRLSRRKGRAHSAGGRADRMGVRAERVRGASRRAASHQAIPAAIQRRHEARCAEL